MIHPDWRPVNAASLGLPHVELDRHKVIGVASVQLRLSACLGWPRLAEPVTGHAATDASLSLWVRSPRSDRAGSRAFYRETYLASLYGVQLVTLPDDAAVLILSRAPRDLLADWPGLAPVVSRLLHPDPRVAYFNLVDGEAVPRCQSRR